MIKHIEESKLAVELIAKGSFREVVPPEPMKNDDELDEVASTLK